MAQLLRSVHLLGCAILFALVIVAPAGAQKAEELQGVALVIGQSDYASLPDLANPGNDARAVAEMLDRLGFDVTSRTDRDADKLRRDLERFVEDAADADVAVIYYSGHGIEGGGDNWIVPVDANAGALEAADSLIALSPVMADLARTVPLTLFFLDACRSSPFPPGTTLAVDGEAYDIADAGLDRPKGAVPLGRTDHEDQIVGTIIGFAAEPGAVAFDGPAGETSYYAAALTRHLGASLSREISEVLRMVTEEVYLKTNRKQRPWVNESLTQLLYFGGEDAEVSEDEALILGERRQLLLTISTLDSAVRRQVETTAEAEGVAMDALFGLIRSLGAEVPTDPAELVAVLKAQVETLKERLKTAAALQRADPEVARLLQLSERAVADGALKANIHFLEAAAARQHEIDSLLDSAERDLKARRIESATVKARLGDGYALDGDYIAAAAAYADAFAQVERWDQVLARTYRFREAGAWYDHGRLKGNNPALVRAIDAYRGTLALMDRTGDRDAWAVTQNKLGNALGTLGERETGTTRLEEAVAAYRAALEEQTRDRAPLDWAGTQNNLGAALWSLGSRERGTARLEEAVAAYRAALEEQTRDRVPLDWALTQNNLGNALQTLGERETGTTRLEEAVAAYRAALKEFTRDRVPLLWAATQNNLGNVLWSLGSRERGTARLEEAIAAYRAALEERTRDRVPLDWAVTQNNLGNALQTLGSRERGTARLEEAIAAYRAALEERTRDRVPLDWAGTQNNLGAALWTLGSRERGTARLEEAVTAYRAALEERTRDRVPLDWAVTQNNLGVALLVLGSRERGTARLEEAVAAYRAALEERTRDRVPLDWAETQNNLGTALRTLGERERGTVRLEEAIAAYRTALEELTRDRIPLHWATTQNNLGTALLVLGSRERGTARLEEAVAAYRAALEERTRDRVPLDWASTSYWLGQTLGVLARRQAPPNNIASWGDAVAAWRNAQVVFSLDTSPERWAQLQNSVGYTLVLIGEVTQDAAGFEEAVTILRSAVEVQEQLTSSGLPHTQDSLCYALLGLGRITSDRAMLLEAQDLCRAALAGVEAAGNDAAATETRANLEALDVALQEVE